MGLLDEAIREHLDLKRRRGADPAEVERAEQEALGPVRRGVHAAEAEAPEHEHEIGAGPGDYPPVEPIEWAEPSEAEPGLTAVPDDLGSPDPATAVPFEPPAPDVPTHDPPPVAEAPPQAPAPPPASAPPPAGAPSPAAAEPPAAPPPPAAAPPPAPAPPPAAGSPSPSPPPLDDQAGGETVEYDVEHALDAEPPEQASDDVLEETPEFLQDTPDHDRLWFEQRPPRDFDFDG
jgi:hypothetical protein